MRIACLHLPAYPLQVILRAELLRRGDAIAVVSASAHTGMMPVVTACSRAARAAGVQLGMTATAARELTPRLALVTADPAAERATIAAIAEALRGISARVDAGGSPVGAHHAIYAEVPARTRGQAFGARIHELCDVMGLSGRVGIADDRFTAHVAATWIPADRDPEPVVSVPRGGSAAFLAPMPLSLLAITGEVRHMLETLGVHTLGEFAALPPPSVARPRLHVDDADWQALARGDGGAALYPFTPSGPITERIAIGEGGGLGAAIGAIAGRLAARLRGREQAAAAIELVVGAAPAHALVLDTPMVEADELADAIGASAARICDTPGIGPVAWIEARVRVAALDGIDVDGAIATPILAEGTAPVATAGSPAPRATVAPGAGSPALHRRTRRGKERPRVVTAQAALFGVRGR